MDTPAWFVLLPSAPNPQYFKSGRFNGLCQFFITEWTLKGDSCRAVFQTNLCSNTIQCIQCRRYTAAAVFTAHPADLYGQAANGSGELFCRMRGCFSVPQQVFLLVNRRISDHMHPPTIRTVNAIQTACILSHPFPVDYGSNTAFQPTAPMDFLQFPPQSADMTVFFT